MANRKMKVFTLKTGNPHTDKTRVGFYGLTHNLWAGVALHDCTCINLLHAISIHHSFMVEDSI